MKGIEDETRRIEDSEKDNAESIEVEFKPNAEIDLDDALHPGNMDWRLHYETTDYKNARINELKCFLSLSTRKEINEWKEKYHMITENEYTGETSLVKDVDVCFNLCRFVDCFEIMDYMDFLDGEDPFENDCKWKPKGKKLLTYFAINNLNEKLS